MARAKTCEWEKKGGSGSICVKMNGLEGRVWRTSEPGRPARVPEKRRSSSTGQCGKRVANASAPPSPENENMKIRSVRRGEVCIPSRRENV
jgi:hypothetical protein